MSSKSLLKLTVSENGDKSLYHCHNSYCCMFKCLSLYPPEMLKCADILNSKDARFSGDSKILASSPGDEASKTQEHVPLNSSVMEGTMCSSDGGDENKQGKST